MKPEPVSTRDQTTLLTVTRKYRGTGPTVAAFLHLSSMVGSLMNDELELIWKETVVAYQQ
jgi:hypothetical protein